MLAITLHQPWASLVMSGQKCFETRSWATAYRGPLLIHASKKWNGVMAAMSQREPFASALRRAGAVFDDKTMPFGAILGTVHLLTIFRIEKGLMVHYAQEGQVPNGTGLQKLPGEPELSFGDYSGPVLDPRNGQNRYRYAWQVYQPEPFPQPILYRGALGLWDCPNDFLKSELVKQGLTLEDGNGQPEPVGAGASG